jgi:quinol-cytochrome oxidoreductase complex cytochrome b subunit
MPTSSRPSFFHHLHPPTIPSAQSRLRYTLGAGGLSVFLILVLTLTGMLEMFYYVPTPEHAGASIQRLTFLVPYGGLIRNLHYWAAQVLVLTVLLHLLRVVFTGAYAGPRRFNYLLGLGLLVLTLFLDFTGYVLRWDEGIRWALVAGTNLVRAIPVVGVTLYGMVMGGGGPGPATLTRFYAWHIFGLTLILFVVATWHIFRVRRDGGIAVPPPEARADPAARITRFELVRREALAALLTTAALLVLASFFPAPLAPAMTDLSPAAAAAAADTRAPWFFLWVQQLLKWGDPFWMGVLIPLGVLIGLGLLPYVLPNAAPHELGRWFPRRARLAQILVALLVIVALTLTMLAAIEGGQADLDPAAALRLLTAGAYA